jgi:ubiquinone/menaquinone biosynthesis C-methylase UbiE
MIFKSITTPAFKKSIKPQKIVIRIFQKDIPNTFKHNTHSLTMASKSFHDAHSNTYERMASYCTLNVARQFLSTLSPPISRSSYILDNACGTGIVTSLIKNKYPWARIKSTDLAPGVIEVVQSKIAENKWEGVETDILDVRGLKTLEDDTFTHVITNFGFSPTPDDLEGPGKAAREMYRVLQKGGVCVVTTWSGRSSSLTACERERATGRRS